MAAPPLAPLSPTPLVGPNPHRLHSDELSFCEAVPNLSQPAPGLTARGMPARRFRRSPSSQLICISQELYNQPYCSIIWPSLRNSVAETDLYAPHTALANVAFAVLNVLDPWIPAFVRRRASRRAYEIVVMEDENTGYQVRRRPRGLGQC